MTKRIYYYWYEAHIERKQMLFLAIFSSQYNPWSHYQAYAYINEESGAKKMITFTQNIIYIFPCIFLLATF